MKKLVVLSFFALGNSYFVACNRENLSPDSILSDAVSAATAGDSTKHKGKHGDSLHIHSDSLRHKGMHGDSTKHKMPKDSLGVKPPKNDSLGHNKPKKGGSKRG
jgi:hypothetical protein